METIEKDFKDSWKKNLKIKKLLSKKNCIRNFSGKKRIIQPPTPHLTTPSDNKISNNIKISLSQKKGGGGVR